MSLNFYDMTNPTVKQRELISRIGHGERVFFGGSRGGGKLSPLESIVMTPYGERKMGDLKVGDIICNPDGTPQRVIQIHPHFGVDIYKIHFEDGASLEVGLDHLWLVRTTSSGKSKCKLRAEESNEFQRGKVMDTKAIIEWLDKKKLSKGKHINNQHLCIPLTNPLKFTKSYKCDMRPVEPYVVGVLIGDGSLTHNVGGDFAYYTSLDPEIGERISGYGYEVLSRGKVHKICGKGIGFGLSKIGLKGKSSADKFIPDSYKYDTVANRIALVQGLMDTDGYVDDRGHMSYTTISERLALDFQWVIRSLGGKASIKKDKAGYKDSDGNYIQCEDAYTVYFNTKMNPDLVHLKRKKDRCKYEFNAGVSELQRRIVGYEYVGKKDARCITVDHPNSLYVADDFVVTHNSHGGLLCAFYVCMKYKNITACIVRKHYRELSDNFIEKLEIHFPREKFRYTFKIKDNEAIFWNGSKIKFRAAENTIDVDKVQGIEFQFLVIDEANQFTIDVIHRLLGSLRNSHVPGFEPSLVMTGNPGGQADQYFKTRYVFPDFDVWEPYELKHAEKYIFIPSSVKDNKHIGNDYIENLENLPEHLRKAWLEGDWNTFSGQFFEEWNERVHVVEDFDPPDDWLRIVGIDEGFTKKHPTVALFGAQNPNTGEVVIYDEYSGPGAIEAHAICIAAMTKNQTIASFQADTSMFNDNKRGLTDESSFRIFMKYGIPLTAANKNRVEGWRVLKLWMHWSDVRKPKVTITRRCRNLIQTIPIMLYDVNKAARRIEDLDTTMEDDFVDAWRYLMMAFGYPTGEDVAMEEEILEDRTYEANERAPENQEYDDFLHIGSYERTCYASRNSYYL